MLEYELLGKLTPMGILSIVLGCLLSYVVQSTKKGIRQCRNVVYTSFIQVSTLHILDYVFDTILK